MAITKLLFLYRRVPEGLGPSLVWDIVISTLSCFVGIFAAGFQISFRPRPNVSAFRSSLFPVAHLIGAADQSRWLSESEGTWLIF